jgi:Fe-S-cluster-containing hydrogenase component 2
MQWLRAVRNSLPEGAITVVDGKAKLIATITARVGNCLPVCPTGAISFEEREPPPTTKPPCRHQRKRQSRTRWPRHSRKKP